MHTFSDYIDHPWLLLLALVVSVPFICQYWIWLFGSVGGFKEDLMDASEWDIFAAFKGHYWEGEWAEFKIGLFILLSILIIATFYKVATMLFE